MSERKDDELEQGTAATAAAPEAAATLTNDGGSATGVVETGLDVGEGDTKLADDDWVNGADITSVVTDSLADEQNEIKVADGDDSVGSIGTNVAQPDRIDGENSTSVVTYGRFVVNGDTKFATTDQFVGMSDTRIAMDGPKIGGSHLEPPPHSTKGETPDSNKAEASVTGEDPGTGSAKVSAGDEVPGADSAEASAEDGLSDTDSNEGDGGEGEARFGSGEEGSEGGGGAGEPPLDGTDATNVPSERLPGVLESLLFVADHPLTATELAALLDEPRKDAIEQALMSLSVAWQERGVQLHNVAGGWQLRTNPRNAVWVQRMVARKPVRLTRSQLETLAICAYRQPITRPEIDEIRGVDSGGTLRTLLDRSLVRILGKKEEAGRPLLYGTTREFLEFFNLRDLRELPTLREFQELSDEHRAQVEALTEAARAAGVGPDSPERPLPPLQRVELSDAPIEEDLGAVDALIQQAEARARTVVDALGGEKEADAARDGAAGGKGGAPAGSSTAATGADDEPGEPEL